MVNWILFILGVFVGIVFTCARFASRLIGNLNIDRSDPSEAPYLFCELKKPIDSFARKKYVLMQVTNRNYISHE